MDKTTKIPMPCCTSRPILPDQLLQLTEFTVGSAYFSTPLACTAPSSNTKLASKRWSFLARASLIFPSPMTQECAVFHSRVLPPSSGG